MQNAGLSENKESLALASIRNTLAFPEASSRMRRLFGPRGNAGRHDVLLAADLDAVSEEADFASWVALRKPEKGKGEKREMRRVIHPLRLGRFY